MPEISDSPPLPDLTGQITLTKNYPSGHGSFANVWIGVWHNEIEPQKVAVKVLLVTSDNRDDIRNLNKRLHRELQIWKRLKHENVLELRGITSEFGPYSSMIYSWQENGNLTEYLKRHGETLLLSHRFRILSEVTAGLSYLHSFSVVHGNMTGGNVLINSKGNACLSDFGLSTIAADVQGSAYFTSTVGGALRWTAPELYRVADDTATPVVSTHSDIYSFGSITLQALTTKVPYHHLSDFQVCFRLIGSESRPQRPPNNCVTDEYWDFINKCWADNPHARPPVDEVARTITVLLSEARLSSPRLTSHPHPGQPSGMALHPQPVPSPGLLGYFYPLEHYMPTSKVTIKHSNLDPGSLRSVGPGSMFEPVVPLEQSANRSVRVSTSRKGSTVELDSPEMVDREVKGLLNKLTVEQFDPISDQIIAWANRSEKEKDGRTLIQVIRLVFEKATDEATRSEMYARLSRKMMEQISSKVQDDGIKNSEGKPIAGGQLFRKYLLNRCQEDFERGWVAKQATPAPAGTEAMEDQAAKAANDKAIEDKAGDVVELYSEEHYAAPKAKRRYLGLIKFIAELFKLQMLTERIMHECVKKLLGNVRNVQNPEEEEIESFCVLLSTVGALLDTAKARAHMDVYFSLMKDLTKSPNVSSRMQFMLQDLTELRERRWVSLNLVAAPTTIAQIRENAAKEKAAAWKDSYNRQIGMSRGGSRRGGGSGPPRPPPKAGDLSNFGKINTPMTFGPSNVFAGKKESGKRESLSRTNSSQTMFSMLQNAEPANDAGSKVSHSRKTSIDMSHSGSSEVPQRRRLVLQPRSKPAAEETTPVPESESSSEDEVAERMSEPEARKKIDEDSKEFFGVRDLEEADIYFTSLPVEHHFRLVDKLVSSAIESKESDAQLVGDFFSRAVAKALCSPAAFEEGFMPVAEILDDIATDAPKAFNFMAIMLKGASLDKDEERRTRITSPSSGDRLLALLL